MKYFWIGLGVVAVGAGILIYADVRAWNKAGEKKKLTKEEELALIMKIVENEGELNEEQKKIILQAQLKSLNEMVDKGEATKTKIKGINRPLVIDKRKKRKV